MKNRKERDFDEHYKELSGDQLLNVYACQGVGFLLWFVRTTNDNKKLAILRQGDKLISVNTNGDIQEEIGITLRNMDSVVSNAA